jgi:diguanylate cyclase (GGDEF)-like protein
LIAEFPSATDSPLFILSFRQRDELVAARRADKAEQRFILSGARIAVIDARGAFEEGVAAIRTLADPVEANVSALLALVSKNDVQHIDTILAAGATHYLASPFGDEEFAQALRFADRYTQRLGSGLRPGGVGLRRSDKPLGWQMVIAEEQFVPDQSLAELFSLDDHDLGMSLSEMLRVADKATVAEAEGAIGRVIEFGAPTAFAHDLPGDPIERVVHHITRSEDGLRLLARVELPDRRADASSLAHRDYLTGLGDAYRSRQWINDCLAKRTGSDPEFVLLLVSFQRFDMINAAFGSAAGDAALQGMARRIERLVDASVQSQSLIARLAGAEFLIGLRAPATLDQAQFLAQQLAGAIEQPFVSEGGVITLKMQCGVVAGGAGDRDATDVLRRASAALAEARNFDGQAIKIYDETKEREVVRASRLEIDLRPALLQDEIEILFQPQVSVTSGAITGVEALARWQHPAFGNLGAVALFAAAERAEYLTELSAHVQSKAMGLAAHWPEQLAHLRLSVNVTAVEIAETEFAERLIARIEQSEFDRSRLTLEVTEGGLIKDLSSAAELLASLRDHGLRVAIDDFGTGYSSLAYLKALPLDYLKIDKRLSQDIAGSSRDRVVVSGVIEMANSLGLSVIAEGVETDEQLSLLAELGCEQYQGFLCAPPLTNTELAELVEQPS